MGRRLVSLRQANLHSTTLFESARTRAARYDSQICKDKTIRLWLRDETKGLTIDESKKPMLSRIFLWYAGDFETRGGSPAYAAQYAPAGAARDALAATAPDYFAYDWNLNTQ